MGNTYALHFDRDNNILKDGKELNFFLEIMDLISFSNKHRK